MSYVRKALGAIGLLLLWIGVLSIPAVQITTCTQGSEDAWLVSLLLYLPASLLILGLAYLGSSKPNGIRWLSLPLFGLVPWAGIVAAKFTYGVTFLGNHLCTVSTGSPFNSQASSWWAVLWGPVQMVFLVLVVWCIYRYWVPAAANKSNNYAPTAPDAASRAGF
jgi:hypothetical protein